MESKTNISPRLEAIEKILYYISSNHLQPDTKIPSERDFSQMLKISRTTVRNALEELISENVIYKKNGIGSFVSPNKYTRNIIGVNNLTRSLRESGTSFSTEILSLRIIKADKQISKKLEIKTYENVYELIRLRSVQSVPCYIETLYLSHNRCPNLERYYTEKSSLFSIFQNIYNLNIVDGFEKISVTYPTLTEVNILEIDPKLPMFFTSGITYTEDKRPLEYYKIIFRSDKFKFSYLLEDKEFKKRKNNENK